MCPVFYGNELFHSYLLNRSQYVEINEKRSIAGPIPCGVPECLILDPPTVHIMNHMHGALSLQSFHYADDVTLFSKGHNLVDLIDFTNTELVRMDKWD